MSHPRIEVRDLESARNVSGIFGRAPREAAPLAARAPVSPAAPDVATPRSWWRLGLRLVRNAAIAVAVMTLVPVALVIRKGDRLARMMYPTNIAGKAVLIEPVRALRLPTDRSITPMQAGIALEALQPARAAVPGFATISPAARPVATWRTVAVAPDLFPTARPDVYEGPSSLGILEAAAARFSPREMEYLRSLATAPVWKEFDLVARAPAVDRIGGQLRVPFAPEALPEQRPLPSFKGSKELAHAAVSRAAYHMALGQRDSAEAVLRSIVSFGFAFVDNGTSGLEAMTGSVIVPIGREALHRFYVIQNDPRADSPALARPSRSMADSSLPYGPEDCPRRAAASVDEHRGSGRTARRTLRESCECSADLVHQRARAAVRPECGDEAGPRAGAAHPRAISVGGRARGASDAPVGRLVVQSDPDPRRELGERRRPRAPEPASGVVHADPQRGLVAGRHEGGARAATSIRTVVIMHGDERRVRIPHPRIPQPRT